MKIRLALAVALFLLTGGAFMQVSRPFADDFCVMRFADTVGLNNAYLQYHTWSGRYASNEATALVHGFAPWLIPVSFAAWFIALFYLLRRVGLSSSLRAWGALLIILAMIGIAPDLYQSYFWTTGLLTYSAPVVLFTWAVLLLDTSPAAAAIVAFLAAGFSDLGALFMVGAFAGLAMMPRRRAALVPCGAALWGCPWW